MRIYSVNSSSLLSLSKITIFALMCLFFFFDILSYLIFYLIFFIGIYHLGFFQTESSTIPGNQKQGDFFCGGLLPRKSFLILRYCPSLIGFLSSFFPMMLFISFQIDLYFSSNFLSLVAIFTYWVFFEFIVK